MMIWRAHRIKHEAVTAEGYRITWVDHHARGAYYNAWTPDGRHIEGGHGDDGKTACKVAREAHLAKAPA